MGTLNSEAFRLHLTADQDKTPPSGTVQDIYAPSGILYSNNPTQWFAPIKVNATDSGSGIKYILASTTRPTLVNNVETLARVPTILERGAEWYQRLGRDGNAGTKVYCLSGHVKKPGAYELPMGATARELIYDYGGGIRIHGQLKAFSPGGVSSGILPAEMVDIPLDYESLTKASSMLGSGAMIVMDDSTCMVDIALRSAWFFAHENCGECTPCRIGTSRVVQILTKITTGHGSWQDAETLKELGERMHDDSRCGLGQSAPLPFLSSLNHFRGEYQAHIEEKRCPSKVCPASSIVLTPSAQEVSV